MRTIVKKLDSTESLEIEHEEGECVFCEAGSRVRGDGIIFFENGSEAQKVEVFELLPGTKTTLCKTVSVAEARGEIVLASLSKSTVADLPPPWPCPTCLADEHEYCRPHCTNTSRRYGKLGLA